MALSDCRVLIMATDGFEQSELFKPRQALLDKGVSVVLAAPKKDPIQGMEHHDKGETITPDTTIDQVDCAAFDALVLPGGVANPDALRQNERAVAIVKDFMDTEKTVAVICHGPWMLVEADVLKGRRVTSWPSLRTDLRNAGAEVFDQEVVIDDNLITSRNPDDLPAFNEALLHALEKVKHAESA